MKLNEILRQSSKDKIDRLCELHEIKDYTINDDGTIDVVGEINWGFKRWKKLPLKFRKVDGNFLIFNNHNLVSLEGCPTEVTGSFKFSAQEITSMKHVPEKVGKDFTVSSFKMKKFDYFPKEIGGELSIFNSRIETLDLLPKEVFGKVSITENMFLRSIKGIPSIVHGNVLINGSRVVQSFEGLPKVIEGKLSLHSFGYLSETPPKNILVVFKIKGLTQIEFTRPMAGDYKKVSDIVNKHLKTGDMIECQEELIEAGFKEYARLK